MDTLEALQTRRTIPVVLPDALPRETVEQLLQAANLAPNHYKVRPWHFVVLQGAARNRFGDLLAEILSAAQPELPAAALDKERAKALRAPLIIAVGVTKTDHPRATAAENLCAAAAASQNLLLAAHALGLGAIWRSGPTVEEPKVKAWLGLDPEQPLIGLIYIGLPDPAGPVPAPRPSYEDRVTWME